MGDQTGIEWCDSTWNPIRGCSRVSKGCMNCYAERVAFRFSGPGAPYEGLVDQHGRWNGVVKLVDHLVDQPLRWRRPRRIFVNSMSDLFHDSVPDDVIDRIFAVMALAYQHTFQVLTKRPGRMRRYLSDLVDVGIGAMHRSEVIKAEVGRLARQRGTEVPLNIIWPLHNVQLGVSVEDQPAAEDRIPDLLATPAAVRFLSIEPLLGAVDLCTLPAVWDGLRRPLLQLDALRGGYWLQDADKRGNWSGLGGEFGPETGRIHWVIVGGESGPGARPMVKPWVRALRDQCVAAGVPFFFKQWGEYGEAGVRCGKVAAGRFLDGRTWSEYPGGPCGHMHETGDYKCTETWGHGGDHGTATRRWPR